MSYKLKGLGITILSLLVVISIPLPIKIHNVSVAGLMIFGVVFTSWLDASKSLSRNYQLSILFVAQFLVISIGFLFSKNIEFGLDEMERSVYPIAMIPIVCLMRSNHESIFRLLKFFAFSCIAVAIFGFFYSWIELDLESTSDLIKKGHINFLEYTGIQPLYLSAYLLLILFHLLEFIRTKYNLLSTFNKLGLVGLIFLVIFIIIFLRSKTSLILLPALLFIYIVIVLKRRGWLVVFMLMFIGIAIFLGDRKTSLNLIDKYGAVSKAFDQRLYIWRGAIEGIKNSPWIGAGTGNTQELLNFGYAKIGYQEGIVNQFNAHNQYLQFLARNGLVELLCFLTLLGYSFWRSIKQDNYTFLMFNMIVSLVMLTESFLSVQKGIAFFYFFLFAFVYLPEKEQNNESV